MSYNRLKSLAANVAAIETAVTVHKQRRKATQEEKQVLAQYSGFGGVKEVLTIGTQIPMPGELTELMNRLQEALNTFVQGSKADYNLFLDSIKSSVLTAFYSKYSINSLVYWVTYVHNVVYSFYRSMIYCYINSTQRCAGSIVIDIIPTNGADKRKFFPFAPYFPVTNVIKRYFYPYFPAIIGIKGYSFPYFPYLSGIMKIKTALYSLFSRLDWHKTVVFPCLGEIYEGIRSLSWEIPVT